MSEKRCCCPSDDARTCYELRHFGRSPVNRGPSAHYDTLDMIAGEPEPDYLDSDVCECSCHETMDEEDFYV